MCVCTSLIKDYVGQWIKLSCMVIHILLGCAKRHMFFCIMAIIILSSFVTAAVSNVEGFISECVLMKDFDHPNVLELVGMYFDEETGSPLILLPYMANGDLRTYLHSKRDFKQSSSILDFPDVRSI